MWIDSGYYNELVKILDKLSKGEFSFDEKNLKKFKGIKYKKITDALIGIQSSSNRHIENSLSIMDSLVAGDWYGVEPPLDDIGEYKKIYDRYGLLIGQCEKVQCNVKKLKKTITQSGELKSRLAVDGLTGIWLDHIKNVNGIIDYFVQNLEEISGVLSKVSQGDLSQKITVEAKGEVLELKKTINTMVDQLSQFSSEVTKVAREVGTEGLLGGQAKVEGVSGVWLDLTNNVNTMSESLAEVDKENKSQNWIKDGISILSKEILYKDMISEQFQITITQLCRYINAGMGVIYSYDVATNTLKLESSYSYEKNIHSKNSFKLGEGVIGQVAYDKKPILIESDTSNRTIRTGTTEYKIFSTYISPLVFEEHLVGVVELSTYEKFDELQIEYLESALSVLAGSFYAVIQTRDNKKLEYISKTDSLTGLNNRGYFDKIVPEILNSGKRSDGLICFAILDIDFFKNFNDTYGHQTGDEVLKSVANVLITIASRDEDLCFRIGGEEFAVIFSAVNKKKAFQFMNKIKDTVEELELKNEKGESIHNITISLGLTCKRASEVESFETLFEETDKLLYKAKESGRNIVIQND